MVADCTGHGVPGAMLSIFGIQLLREITRKHEYLTPKMILKELDKRFKEYLFDGLDEFKNDQISDGMDLGIITLEKTENLLRFAGANRPMFFWRQKDKKLTTYRGSRIPIGNYEFYKKKDFKEVEIPFETRDRIFLFSDGFHDQFGGIKGKKMRIDRMHAYTEDSCHLSLREQKKFLSKKLNNWKKDSFQTDDILLVGVEV